MAIHEIVQERTEGILRDFPNYIITGQAVNDENILTQQCEIIHTQTRGILKELRS